MWHSTDDKASYFMIEGANKTHDEQRQHQSTLFLLSYVLYATKWLCKNDTLYITRRNNYNYVAGGAYGKAGILVVEKKFCGHSLKTR